MMSGKFYEDNNGDVICVGKTFSRDGFKEDGVEENRLFNYVKVKSKTDWTTWRDTKACYEGWKPLPQVTNMKEAELYIIKNRFKEGDIIELSQNSGVHYKVLDISETALKCERINGEPSSSVGSICLLLLDLNYVRENLLKAKIIRTSVGPELPEENKFYFYPIDDDLKSISPTNKSKIIKIKHAQNNRVTVETVCQIGAKAVVTIDPRTPGLEWHRVNVVNEVVEKGYQSGDFLVEHDYQVCQVKSINLYDLDSFATIVYNEHDTPHTISAHSLLAKRRHVDITEFPKTIVKSGEFYKDNKGHVVKAKENLLDDIVYYSYFGNLPSFSIQRLKTHTWEKIDLPHSLAHRELKSNCFYLVNGRLMKCHFGGRQYSFVDRDGNIVKISEVKTIERQRDIFNFEPDVKLVAGRYYLDGKGRVIRVSRVSDNHDGTRKISHHSDHTHVINGSTQDCFNWEPLPLADRVNERFSRYGVIAEHPQGGLFRVICHHQFSLYLFLQCKDEHGNDVSFSMKNADELVIRDDLKRLPNESFWGRLGQKLVASSTK